MTFHTDFVNYFTVKMVNKRAAAEELDTRDRLILERLRVATSAVSGQDLADSLGISRVALWKRIEHLKTFSYRIESSSRGYRLVADDVVAPWEFEDGRLVVYRSETGSTMDDAWKRAENGEPAGTLVVADRQSAGRGRLGRQWLSPSGGLYLTVVLRTPLPASYISALVLESATMIANWLAENSGCQLGFQWPNDLMSEERKVGGLLVEMAGSPENPRFYTVGLGINVQAVGLPDRQSVGLADLSERPPQRRVLAAAFRSHLLDWCHNPEFEVSRWEQYCVLKGKSVDIRDWRGQEHQGTVTGFDERGGLRVQVALPLSKKPSERIFLPGETTMVRPAQPDAITIPDSKKGASRPKENSNKELI